jgi:ParB family chromosome partitioning protein
MLNVPDAVKLAKLPRAKRQRLLKRCDGEPLDETMYDERYSPLWAIKGAKTVMGRIDVDPASCAAANSRVRATTYYDSKMDGLAKPWRGRVFLNVPYAKCSAWIRKLSAEVENGNTKQVVLLCPVRVLSLIIDSCRPLLTGSLLFPNTRIKYLDPTTEKLVGTAFASLILYVGPNQRRFFRVFGKHGTVFRPVATD